MNENCSAELAPAVALVNLLTAKPALGAIVWKVGEIPGVLYGHHISESGCGELVDMVAAVTGGTVARASVSRSVDDRQGVAELVADYCGASVHVSATYHLPDDNGRTSADLREILAARRLGTLVCLPGGDAR